MSMQTLTCLQIAWAFSAYTFAVLGLPWLVLHKRFARYPWQERWMGYFLAGNFYLINLVFVLQFLHISNRVTLILGTVLPFAVPYLWKNRGLLKGILFRIQRKFISILKGERKIRTELSRNSFADSNKKKQEVFKLLQKSGLEMLCVIALLGALLYVYGTGVVIAYGYKASDIVVHNYWINLMDENQIFHAGVYPHGFHCIVYYLEKVFGIPTFVLLRVLSLVDTIYIYLALLIPLRALCKSRYLPYIGMFNYALIAYIGSNTYSRYSAALPQEYGMLFIVPAGFFAIRFFQDFSPQLLMLEKEKAKCGKEKVQFDLVFFIISFSLTITVHFYDTMIAGLFCVGIALAYVKELFNWKYFSRIIGAGILSVALAVLPMAIGVAQGNKLQGSLYWGLNIITGSTDDEDTAESTGTDETEAVSSEVSTTDIVLEKPQEQKEQINLQTVVESVHNRVYIDAIGMGTHYGSNLAYMAMVSSFLLLLIGFLQYRQDGTQAKVEISIGWLGVLMLIVLSASRLHLPEIMDPARSSIFFNYTQIVVWSMIVDGAILLFFGKSAMQRFRDVLSLFLLIVLVPMSIFLFGIRRPVGKSQSLETNQAMTCTANILRENKRFNWTICSANEERQMILSEGRHEELITFLRKIEKVNQKNISVTIPTQYVYFYIEKLPINYYGSLKSESERQRVSEEGAREKLSEEGGLQPYSGTNRWVTMSHIYYWALAFQKLHPDAMEVYYEDEDFVCYRLTQNVNSLYELAIDYGYNDP